MDSQSIRILLIVLIAVVLGGGIPFFIYLGLRRDKTSLQISMLQKAARYSQQPWKKEEEDLKELARRVAELKNSRKAGGPSEQAENHTQEE